MRGVLFITVEGMGTSLVGAYGANIGATPAIDELAARGIVLDQCFLDSQDLQQQLTSLVTGQHAMQSPTAGPNLWHLLEASSLQCRFITDSPTAAEWAAASGCEEITLVEPPASQQIAMASHECAVVSLFANAAEVIGDISAMGFVWIHSSGLRLPWDAPKSLRAQFTDPDDPDPPQEVGPPVFDVAPDTDPDTVVGWGQVAAAQVSVIDDCVEMLVSLIANRSDRDNWACCILGLGGVPLGEHGRVGWGRPQLHGEELHCAAIVRPAPAAPIGWRVAELSQLPDIAVTLAGCLGLADDLGTRWGQSLLDWVPSDIPFRWRNVFQVAILRTPLELWLRSPAWSICWRGEDARLLEDVVQHFDQLQVQLYVKPDDRWEVSEIGDRCPHIVEALGVTAVAMLACLAESDRLRLPPLEESLCELLR